MKTRRLIVLAVVAAAVVLVIGVGSVLFQTGALVRMFSREAADVLAATTVSPPTATPTSRLPSATPVVPSETPQPTVQSTSAPEAVASQTAEGPTDVPPAPTRVVLPAEPITLPPGFGISVFASDLNDPRMMALGPDGALYLAERGNRRIVRLPDRDGDGVADGVEVAADGLEAPSSLAFHPDGSLYVGETTRVQRLTDPDGDGLFDQHEVIVDGLPSGGHNTRTVLLSPDGATLFVSIGSSCNVCEEADGRRATVMRYNHDGSDEAIYASGMRNAVGITFRPGTDELWATNNGRDRLGDDQPPETVYLAREGDDAGWPRCHAGRIEDPEYGGPGSCDGVAPPVLEMQAHSAPLGLTFYGGDRFPEGYQGDLFIAFHGSWNRTTPTGYKVVRVPMGDGGVGGVEDFAAGWLRADGSQWGRPVDVLTGSDGSLYVSDDGGGRIYRIFYEGP